MTARESSAEIVCLALTLSARSEITLVGNGGEAVHGLFFARLKAGDPETAGRVHAARQKPFALLLEPALWSAETGKRHLATGATLRVTLNLFSADLGESVVRAFLKKPARMALSEGFVTVQDLQVRTTSFDALMDSANPAERIRLRFISPTCFRQRGRSFVFPEPSLVFGSLLSRWNAFTASPLPETLPGNFRALLVARYRLRTALVPFSRYSIVGFTGDCEYILPKGFAESDRARILALARFAQYSGIGYKTTMGLGATSLLQM
jgi:CRISPR-associated endoribonuclease Cas6